MKLRIYVAPEGHAILIGTLALLAFNRNSEYKLLPFPSGMTERQLLGYVRKQGFRHVATYDLEREKVVMDFRCMGKSKSEARAAERFVRRITQGFMAALTLKTTAPDGTERTFGLKNGAPRLISTKEGWPSEIPG